MAIELHEKQILASAVEHQKVARRRIQTVYDKAKWWEEYPVSIEEFVNDSCYLGLRGMVWQAVMDDLRDIFNVKEVDYLGDNRFSTYQEVVLDEAIGSGKSFISSIAISYIVYRLLCMKNPQQFFGLAPGSLMAVMNMAPTATQAKNVVFGEIKSRIDCSPWFKDFGGMDDSIRSVLRFNKGITILPGNSSETFPLGYSLIAWIMDEGAFYTDTLEHDVAQEIYYSLMRRSQSRFRDRWLGVMISSPRYTDDFIERKMTEAKQYPELIFSRRRAIWESKPDDVRSVATDDYFELDGVRIPNVYKKAFMENPEKAWRDLGAKPSLVLEPYFKQWSLIEQCVVNSYVHPISEDGKFADWFKGNDKVLYFAHIDLGLTNDACGLAVVHKEDDGTIIADLILRIKAMPGQEIDLLGVRSWIYEMRERGFHFGKISYDQFQSADSIQEFKRRGFEVEKLSVDATLAPYETLKEKIYQGKFKCYRYDMFFAELRRLELIGGKKVDHPAKGSKDVADAVAGAVYNAVIGEGSREMSFTIV